MRLYPATGAAVMCLLSAPIASAQDTDFKVVISGDAQFQGAYIPQKRDSQTRQTEFRNRLRLVVTAAGTTEAGLTYGGRVRMRTTGSGADGREVDFDRAYVNVGGAFGTLYLGAQTSFNDDIGAGRPLGYLIEEEAPFDFFSASNAPEWTNGALDISGLFPLKINVPEAASKVRYDSPSLSGLRLSASYTPRSDDRGFTVNRDRSGRSGAAQDVFEAGLLFDNTDMMDRFGGVAVSASLGYQTAEQDLYGSKDITAYQGGLSASYAGFTAGGGMTYFGTSGLLDSDPSRKDQYSYNVGIQYETGPFAVGASHTYGEKDADPNGGGHRKLWAWEIGAMYDVAAGLAVGAEYTHITTKNSALGIKDVGGVFLISAQANF